MRNVIIYSTPACQFCHAAKEFFNKNNIEFTEYDVASDAEKRAEMIKKSGQMGVPVILIDDSSAGSGQAASTISGQAKMVIGFDQNKLKTLLGI